MTMRQRGIYFVSTLAIAVVVSMVVTAAIFAVRGSLKASEHLTTGDAAMKAAESGLRYAQSKLCENPAWRGDDNGITVQEPDLVVEEQDGNVVGILRSPQGAFSQFRIRFNWQDGTQAGTDGFNDPPANFVVDHPYVSINNIPSGSPQDVPRADGPGFSVTGTSQRPYQVPHGSACLIVEGRTGSGLAALGPSNLNPPVAPGGVTSRVIEVNLRVGQQPGADAAAMAAGDVTGTLSNNGSSQFTVSSKSGVPRVRSKKTVEITGGDSSANYLSPHGEVHSQDGQLHANFSDVTTDFEQDDASFYKLEWADVKKAVETDDQLPAGTYVLWDDGTLHYYDMGYDEYVTHIEGSPNDPGQIAALPTAMTLDGSTLTISKNVFVESTSQTAEFNFIPRQGAREDPEGAGGGGGDNGIDVANPESLTSFASGLPAPRYYNGSQGGTAVWRIPGQTPPPSYIRYYFYGNQAFQISISDAGSGMVDLELTDFTEADLNPPITGNPNPTPSLAAGLQIMAGSPAHSTSLANLLSYLDGPGSGMKELDLPGVPASELDLTADDLTVEFVPQGGQTAILSADGDINIASKVQGTGGTLTSQGNIRFVGAGSDLAADKEEGLNLYAKGDIILSSLEPQSDGSYNYKDFRMKGVLYTWGDFKAKIGFDDPAVNSWGNFFLEGALVAYGNKNLENLAEPGDGDGGAIDITAGEVELIFDAAYLTAVSHVVDPGRVEQTLYTVHR